MTHGIIEYSVNGCTHDDWITSDILRHTAFCTIRRATEFQTSIIVHSFGIITPIDTIGCISSYVDKMTQARHKEKKNK